MARELKNLDRSAGWQGSSVRDEATRLLHMARIHMRLQWTWPQPRALRRNVSGCRLWEHRLGQFLPLSLVPPLPQLHSRAWARLHLHHRSRQQRRFHRLRCCLWSHRLSLRHLLHHPLSRHLPPHHRVYLGWPRQVSLLVDHRRRRRRYRHRRRRRRQPRVVPRVAHPACASCTSAMASSVLP